ncbi:uncharacterized protein LOC141691881 [Apium graveolens]|uniref:uncharacterized protein LOC141691881 n=1 Tax=Apium graveolens TaxID=4045 RepID=UPI003D7BF984
MVTEATIVMDFIDAPDEPQGRGSRPGKSSNHHRQRQSREKNLMEDYFIDRPIFSEDDFRRRFKKAPSQGDFQVWYAFFGVPGAQNDINVLGQSPVFDKVIAGNSPTVVFHVNGKRYNNEYYLVDRIYPRYSTFVKTISNLATQSQKLFAKKQEAYHKDVERCFGILQSRWAIFRHSA